MFVSSLYFYEDTVSAQREAASRAQQKALLRYEAQAAPSKQQALLFYCAASSSRSSAAVLGRGLRVRVATSSGVWPRLSSAIGSAP